MSDLFYVTIRRTYTPEFRAKWSGPETSDSTHPRFAETAEEIWATNFYTDSRYADEVFAVERATPERLAEERAKAADLFARLRSTFERRGDHYEPCCELAILRPCVCSISYLCPVHGSHCHGSHD